MNNTKCTTTLRIKGTKYYSAETLLFKGLITSGSKLSLLREPSNSHDNSAVAIHLKQNNEKLGYISRSVSKKYFRLIEGGLITDASVLSTGQADKYGPDIRIKVTYIDALAQELPQQENSSSVEKSRNGIAHATPQRFRSESPNNDSRLNVPASETVHSAPKNVYANNSGCLGVFILLITSPLLYMIV
jgi:hypothetical protein